MRRSHSPENSTALLQPNHASSPSLYQPPLRKNSHSLHAARVNSARRSPPQLLRITPPSNPYNDTGPHRANSTVPERRNSNRKYLRHPHIARTILAHSTPGRQKFPRWRNASAWRQRSVTTPDRIRPSNPRAIMLSVRCVSSLGHAPNAGLRFAPTLHAPNSRRSISCTSVVHWWLSWPFVGAGLQEYHRRPVLETRQESLMEKTGCEFQ